MQDCSNSNANALELLQFCIKPSIDTADFHEFLETVDWYGFIKKNLLIS